MPESPKRPSRPNRFGIGFLSIAQILLLLIAVILINFLSSKNHERVDLSRDADFSLSESSRNYLQSGALSKRKQAVKWLMVFRRSSPFYARVRAIAEEYAEKSNGKIELEILDPIRSPDRASQLIATYKLTLASDLLLIDAREDNSSPVVSENDLGNPTLSPNITIALAQEMLSYTTDEKGQRKPDSFLGEDLLTARLVEAVEGKPRNFLFFADKSRVDTEDERSPWNNLSTTLRYRNIHLIPSNLAGLKSIPPQVEGVAIVAPKYDFTPEEIATLNHYWNQPRAAFLILLEAGQCPPALRTFLREKGITPRKDRVITRIDNRIVSTARGNINGGIPFLKDLAGQSAIFEGASSSLEVREGADDLAVKKIAPSPLVSIGRDFWGETDYGKSTPNKPIGETFDPIRDNAAPLHIAAAVVRGAENDDRYAEESSRMIVIANTDFLDKNRQRAENIDLVASSANWLIRRESLIGSGSRPIGTYKLPLFEAEVTFINRLNLIFIPLGFLLIGATIFSIRRA